MKNRRPLALAALVAAAMLPLAACSSDDTTDADPTTTTAAATTTTAAEVTAEATTTTERAGSGPMSGDELSAALTASGDYTEDQVMSMTVWQGVACDMRDVPQVADMWNVEGIRADIQENYGFTPSADTAKVLRDSCG
ncbi:hypothetical protein PBI_HUFFY_32 [Gordonia phage Huffy]|uniref:Uncharacterized protein n=1 Tax=Gordonia phage TZGordon TaxID=2744004 RepID=A0A6N0A6X6_9CAUD|nr:lipoprotein [Gordonia phage TZGordon]AQY55634.1 hypothetical protein PBI_HUFFY_32 [Gordonia phage Huffy]AQY55716.1 hypothetical protein PBI_DINODARYN_32 [Gordonia phage DinoDaryn]QKO02953.1 hypothetical protein SEA_TZGORDON_32 [Gordonia phage TZGordon]